MINLSVRASNIENSNSEDENYPLKASDMKDLILPAKPLYRINLDLDATIVSSEDSEKEPYNRSITSEK